jgi:hypothetical protein
MKARRIHKEQLVIAIGANPEDGVAGRLGTIRGDHEPLL